VQTGRPRQPLRIAAGTLQTLGLLSTYKPDLVVGFGSFHTFPVLLAARLRHIPIILHEGNATPGRVNRLFSRRALLTGVQFPNTKLLGKTVHMPLPLRPHEPLEPAAARTALGLDPDCHTIVVMGGSQGALRLNQVAHEALSTRTDIQVIHLTGHGKPLPPYPFPSYVVEFEHRMDLVWSAADLVIMRAGASSIAEHLAYRVPAILVPYPHAADDHQNANADRAIAWGGAHKIREAQLTPMRLLALLDEPTGRPRAPAPETDLYTTICQTLGLTL
jgi:UDP-N-acetylglucosamine--N-acetylmuramyl-(pentapeptide) pyrophosphoryl-undecaprenol N-acetylglucosamine transferase